MTPEQLLKPRIMVINTMPLMINKVGDILPCVNEDCGPHFEIAGINWLCPLSDFKQWPHIFREMSWWEGRETSELPEYVKNGKETIYKVELFAYNNSQVKCTDIDSYCDTCFFQPSTQTEYNEYINKSK